MRVQGIDPAVLQRVSPRFEVRSPLHETGTRGVRDESVEERATEKTLRRSVLEQQRRVRDQDEARSAREMREAREAREERFRTSLLEEENEGFLQQMTDALQQMNGTAENQLLSLRFRLHEESERWMVQIVDIMEDEIVREIPPEQMLNMAAQIQSMIGVMVDVRR